MLAQTFSAGFTSKERDLSTGGRSSRYRTTRESTLISPRDGQEAGGRLSSTTAGASGSSDSYLMVTQRNEQPISQEDTEGMRKAWRTISNKGRWDAHSIMRSTEFMLTSRSCIRQKGATTGE